MKRTATFSIFRGEQPDEATWEAAVRFATGPQGHGQHWKLLVDVILRAEAVVGSPEHTSLQNALTKLHESLHVVWMDCVKEELDAEERESGAFAWILGIRLDTDRRTFSRQGRTRAVDGVYTIQEKLLDGPGANGDDVLPAVAEGWDFVNLPHGLVISDRVARWFAEWKVKGVELRPLISSTSGEPSTRAHQLLATTFLPGVCLEHTGKQLEISMRTGAVISGGGLGEAWSMRSDAVKDLDLWSRDAQRQGALYLSRAVLNRLKEHRVNGLLTEKCVQICEHGRPLHPNKRSAR